MLIVVITSLYSSNFLVKIVLFLYRIYMNSRVLIFFNKLGKEIKCEAYQTINHCFSTSLINSII